MRDNTKEFLLEKDEHNFKKGDIIRVDTNGLFDYEIIDILKWHDETILCVSPTDRSFNDCKSLILTRYNKIYKEVNK